MGFPYNTIGRYQKSALTMQNVPFTKPKPLIAIWCMYLGLTSLYICTTAIYFLDMLHPRSLLYVITLF
jgi:hypothetical protein